MKFIMSVFMVVMVAGCNSKAGDHTSDSDKPEAPVCGSWSWNQDDCECKGGKTLIESEAGAQCVNLASQNFCLSTKNGYQIALAQKDPNVWTSCLRFSVAAAKKLPLQNPDLGIALYDATKQEQKRFAVWADSHTAILESLDSWVSASQQMGEYLVVTNKVVPFVREMLNPFVMPVREVDYMQMFPAPKVFRSVDQLIAYLENPNSKSDIQETHFSFDPRARAALNYYKTNWALEPHVITDTLSAFGCEGSCSRETAAQKSAGYMISHREFVVEGRVFRSEIVVRDASSNIVAALYLAGAQVSAVMLFDRDDRGLALRTRVYNDVGQTLHTQESGTQMSSATLLNERESWLQSTRISDYNIAICETHFEQKALFEKGIASHIQFGPYQDSSYFGWIENPLDNEQFWQGRLHFNLLGLPMSLFDYGTHAARVGDIAVTNPEGFHVGIVPLGLDSCLDPERFQRTWPAVKNQANVRVVNLSLSEQSDETSCLEKLQKLPISGGEDVLWVLAAGNQSSKQNINCPQYLSGQRNVIVVGAGSSYSLEGLSNRGEWVDVAASGFGKEYGSAKDGLGTSFAAPRVSRLAAKMFHLYPELSAYEVKLAILLGSRYIGDHYDVRAKGDINEARAFQYADVISSKSNIETHIAKIECKYGSMCEAAAFKRYLYHQLQTSKD